VTFAVDEVGSQASTEDLEHEGSLNYTRNGSTSSCFWEDDCATVVEIVVVPTVEAEVCSTLLYPTGGSSSPSMPSRKSSRKTVLELNEIGSQQCLSPVTVLESDPLREISCLHLDDEDVNTDAGDSIASHSRASHTSPTEPLSPTAGLWHAIPDDIQMMHSVRSWGYPGDAGSAKKSVVGWTFGPSRGTAAEVKQSQKRANSPSGTWAGRGSTSKQRGSAMEDELTNCEAILREYEEQARFLHSDCRSPKARGPTMPWAELRSQLLALGRRVDVLHADAFDAGCSRSVPGAMAVFEAAGIALERVAKVVQLCDKDVGGPAAWPLPNADLTTPA